MDPDKAWELLDEITTFDAQYCTSSVEKKRGLYEIPKEIDRDVRAQFQQDEATKMRKLVQSLKACQICHSQDHSASECSHSQQVNKAEGYISEPLHH